MILISGLMSFSKPKASIPSFAAIFMSSNATFTLLAKGRTDVVVWGLIEGLNANGILGRENEELRQATEKIRVLQPPLKTLPKYLFLNKRHIKLIPEIDAALKEMKKNGAYQRIYDRAFGEILLKNNIIKLKHEY